jgi:hypothetical protein
MQELQSRKRGNQWQPRVQIPVKNRAPYPQDENEVAGSVAEDHAADAPSSSSCEVWNAHDGGAGVSPIGSIICPAPSSAVIHPNAPAPSEASPEVVVGPVVLLVVPFAPAEPLLLFLAAVVPPSQGFVACSDA